MSSKGNRIIKTLIFINAVFLLIIIFFTPLAYYIFNLDYYEYLYEKNGVFSTLKKDDVMDLTVRIFGFFKYRQELDPSDPEIQVRFNDESRSSTAVFNHDEIDHLKDVRSLLLKIFISYFLCIVFFITLTFFIIKIETAGPPKNFSEVFTNSLINFSKIFIISSGTLLFFILILYFLGNNFPVLFDNFHKVFFPQGNYMFISGSLIITIFPFGFFYDFFTRIILVSAVISGLILVIGLVFYIIGRHLKKDKYREMIVI